MQYILLEFKNNETYIKSKWRKLYIICLYFH